MQDPPNSPQDLNSAVDLVLSQISTLLEISSLKIQVPTNCPALLSIQTWSVRISIRLLFLMLLQLPPLLKIQKFQISPVLCPSLSGVLPFKIRNCSPELFPRTQVHGRSWVSSKSQRRSRSCHSRSKLSSKSPDSPSILTWAIPMSKVISIDSYMSCISGFEFDPRYKCSKSCQRFTQLCPKFYCSSSGNAITELLARSHLRGRS